MTRPPNTMVSSLMEYTVISGRRVWSLIWRLSEFAENNRLGELCDRLFPSDSPKGGMKMMTEG